MNDNQKQVAAWVAVAVLAFAVAFVVWLALTAAGQGYLNTSDPEKVRLSSHWELAAYLIRNGAILNSLFAAFLAVLSVAVTLVADIYTRKRDIALISSLCILGIVFALIALVRISAGPALADLALYGGIDAAKAEGLSQAFFGALIGWFGTFLATVLGISLTSANGVLRGSIGGQSAPAPSPPPPPPPGGQS